MNDHIRHNTALPWHGDVSSLHPKSSSRLLKYLAQLGGGHCYIWAHCGQTVMVTTVFMTVSLIPALSPSWALHRCYPPALTAVLGHGDSEQSLRQGKLPGQGHTVLGKGVRVCTQAFSFQSWGCLFLRKPRGMAVVKPFFYFFNSASG